MTIRLSYSAANRFKQCPQKYYFSKDWTTKVRGSALAFGTALEDGITQMLVTESLENAISMFHLHWENEDNNPQKPVFDNPDIDYYKSDFDAALVSSNSDFVKTSFEDLSMNKHYDDWQTAYEDALKLKNYPDKPEYYEDLMTFYRRVCWWSLRLKGEYMLKSFHKQVFPQIERVIDVGGVPGCQFKIELENEHGDSLIGYIDYVIKFKGRDKPAITDCKTSSIKYTEHDILTSDQLRTYVYALKAKHDLDCEACYMVIGKRMKKNKSCVPCGIEYSSTKRKCSECSEKLSIEFEAECQLLFTEYDQEILEEEMSDYENILDAIDNGTNFRNTSNCMAFGRPCEFYDVCWKGKNPEDLSELEPKKKRK